MNRQIKFRGFNKDLNQWIYGFYQEVVADGKMYPYIFWQGNAEPVEPESVGQLAIVSKHEKSKKLEAEIFEGDIFRQEIEHEHGDERHYLIVAWVRQRGAFYLIPVEHYQILLDNDCEAEKGFDWLFEEADLYDFVMDVESLPLVGNMYQHPDLLNK